MQSDEQCSRVEHTQCFAVSCALQCFLLMIRSLTLCAVHTSALNAEQIIEQGGNEVVVEEPRSSLD